MHAGLEDHPSAASVHIGHHALVYAAAGDDLLTALLYHVQKL
jgi:hypothetical protein